MEIDWNERFRGKEGNEMWLEFRGIVDELAGVFRGAIGPLGHDPPLETNFFFPIGKIWKT